MRVLFFLQFQLVYVPVCSEAVSECMSKIFGVKALVKAIQRDTERTLVGSADFLPISFEFFAVNLLRRVEHAMQKTGKTKVEHVDARFHRNVNAKWKLGRVLSV